MSEQQKQKLAEQGAQADAEVREAKKYLLAPADQPFDFKPSLWKSIGKPDTLRFHKITLSQLLELEGQFPNIPPRFTQKRWAKREWEDLPDELKEWWKEPRDPTKEEARQAADASYQLLSMASADKLPPDRWKNIEPIVQNECLAFVQKISGIGNDAEEILDWFRHQQ